MARTENQKQKIFRVLEILMRETDEEIGITVNEMIDMLAEYGISAERKSIYSDLAELEALGFSVIRLDTSPPRYTLGERIFELPELKMLADAIGASKFITAEKSEEIINKLRLFAGKAGAGELSRSILVEGRIKTENPTALYTLDAIHKALNEKRQINFMYYDYTPEKKRYFRHDGMVYRVSPKALILSDGNYYLVGYDEVFGKLKNFRIDKMYKTSVSELAASINSDRYNFNPADYSRKIFGMYSGEEELVTLEARDRLAGVVIDRFGKSVPFIKSEFGFKFSVRVLVSPTFFSWLMSFGADMRIISPAWAKDKMKDILAKIIENYE